jgi:hypothetical protein
MSAQANGGKDMGGYWIIGQQGKNPLFLVKKLK